VVVQLPGCRIEGLGNVPTNADKSFQYLLLRFLLGTATASRGSLRAKQSVDYSSLPAVVQAKTPRAAVTEFLTAFEVGCTASRFVKITIADNREFYREILCEFINCHLQTIQGRHTGAFVFLYRILERISFTVPLLYASTQTDYVGTFNDLKAMLNGEKDGELALFRKFLSQGRFIDELKLQVNQTVTFTSAGGHANAYFDLVTKRFKDFTSIDAVASEVEIEFSRIPQLLITLRNRFFHLRTGDGMKNISSTELPDSDEFFQRINPITFSFLAMITLHTLAAKYRAT
jgi:hypothetical protein